MNLTPYVDALSAAMSIAPDWRNVALPSSWLGDIGADIRLSADSVRIGGLAAGNAAASVSLRDGRLEIGLARAVFGDGSLSGALAISDPPHASEAVVEAQLRANDIAFAAPAATIGLPEAVSGTASLLVDVSTKGRDIGAHGRSALRHGAARREGRRRSAFRSRRDRRGGERPGRHAVGRGLGGDARDLRFARAEFSGELGTVERGSVVTPSYSADLRGWIGLHDGSLGLNGAIKPGPQDLNTVAAADRAMARKLSRLFQGLPSRSASPSREPLPSRSPGRWRWRT